MSQESGADGHVEGMLYLKSEMGTSGGFHRMNGCSVESDVPTPKSLNI